MAVGGERRGHRGFEIDDDEVPIEVANNIGVRVGVQRVDLPHAEARFCERLGHLTKESLGLVVVLNLVARYELCDEGAAAVVAVLVGDMRHQVLSEPVDGQETGDRPAEGGCSQRVGVALIREPGLE